MVISKKMSLVALTISLLFGCVPHGVAMRKKPEQPKKDNKIVSFFKNNGNTFKNALLVSVGALGGYMMVRYMLRQYAIQSVDVPRVVDAVKPASPANLSARQQFLDGMAKGYLKIVSGGIIGAGTALFKTTLINLFDDLYARATRPAPQKKRTEDVYINALETAPTEIKELYALLENRDLDENINDYLPLGYILHGPPGCGKTEIAKAMAQKIGVHFQIIKHSDIASGTINISSSNLKYKLDAIKARLPENGIGIVFIDEIDTVAPQRMPGNENNAGIAEDNKIVNVLLQEIQGFDSQNRKLIIIGATNRIDIIDKAVLSRLTPIPMHAPNYQERKKAIEHQSIKLCDEAFCNEILKLLARETEGFSYRDLSALLRSFGRKILISQASNPDSVRVLMECLREEKLNVANRAQPAEDSKPPQSMYS